jgi:Predicted kinase
MQKIIILRGNSGSGKTTVGKAIQEKVGQGTMLISQDVIRREILYVKDRPGNKAVDLLETMVKFAYDNCELAILEGILNVDKYQKLFDTVISLYGENIFAYYFDLPFEETLERHKLKPQAAEYGEEEMRKWWQEKDYIPNIREENLVKEMSEAEILALIYEDIR